MNPLESLEKFDTDLFNGMAKNRELAFSDGEIEYKNKILIALAIDAARGTIDGVSSLISQARNANCSEKEIAEVFRVVHYICGGSSMYPVSLAIKKSNEQK